MDRARRTGKALLRQAFAGLLPEFIVARPKQKFSTGTGSSELIAEFANDTVSDSEFVREMERLQKGWDYQLARKEALFYYRILREFYEDGEILLNTGVSRSLSDSVKPTM